MTTFAEFLCWEAAPVAAAAEQASTAVAAAERAAAGLVGLTPPAWAGAAAGAALAAESTALGLAEDHASDVRVLAIGLARAADTFAAALADRDDALSRARGEGLHVGADGTVVDTLPAAPDVDPGAHLAARQALVDSVAASLGAAFGAALLADVDLADVLRRVFQGAGRVRDGKENAPSTLPTGHVEGYRVGPPTRPDFTWDEDFAWNTASPTAADWAAREKWMAMLEGGRAATLATKASGGRLVDRDLTDGIAMYEHYWGNTGDPVTFDYEKAVREDENIRRWVGGKISETTQAVDEMVRSGRTGEFDITGPPTGMAQDPSTENWQKAIGKHQMWSSGHVRVADGVVTMEVVVHGEDHYNFNRGMGDIASGAPDDENGRFTEVGWAKPFDSSGTVTRTVSWPVGSPPPYTLTPLPKEGR